MDKQININRYGRVGLQREVIHKQRWRLVSCGPFTGKVAPPQVSCRGLRAWAYPNIRVMLKLSAVKSGSLAFSSTHFNWVPVVDRPLSPTTLRAQRLNSPAT